MLLVGHYRFNNPVAVERAQTGANACRRLLHPGITSALHTGMAPERRSELVAVRFTPAELTMLHELAEVDGLYQSDVIRLLIRRAHVTRFKATKKKTTKASVPPKAKVKAKAKRKC